MILSTPNYSFARSVQESAPPGVIARAGRQSAYAKDDPDATAPVLIGIKEREPTQATKDRFVEWLVTETSKDDRCTINYYGEVIPKEKEAVGAIYDLMLERKSDLDTL